jgi:hypothetical protein
LKVASIACFVAASRCDIGPDLRSETCGIVTLCFRKNTKYSLLLRGRVLPQVQKTANRRIARRLVRIEPVNSCVKRCRIVHDTNHLRKAGIRDLVMEVCCARHNFRVCLTPWQPMV